MIKKEKQILLRLDEKTYKMIKFLSDKYDRSINSEINLLLRACVSKWSVKQVKVHELPREIKEIQDDEWDSTEYDRLLESIKVRKSA